MKNLLALVAVVLCLLVAYQMHRDRLEAGKKASAEAVEVVKRPLSEYIEPFRKELFAPINDRKPVDLVPSLQDLKQRVIAQRNLGDGSSRAICDAGLAALDQMIAAAEYRTQSLKQLLALTARPTSSLERNDSKETSSAFFKESMLRKAEAGRLQRQPAVEEALAALARVETHVAAEQGMEAAQDDYGYRRTVMRYLRPDGSDGPGNPLERGAYDQRRVIIPRQDRQEQGQGSSN